MLLVLGGTAFADQFYFVSAGSVTWNGVYVTPYLANDNTQDLNNLTIYCDDWNTEFFGNPTWNANVYALTAANVPNFKFGELTADYRMTLNPGDTLSFASSSANVLDLYLEAAWLDNQLRTTSPTVIQQEELAAAMWTLFVDGADVGGLVAGINDSGRRLGCDRTSRQRIPDAGVSGLQQRAGTECLASAADGRGFPHFDKVPPQTAGVIGREGWPRRLSPAVHYEQLGDHALQRVRVVLAVGRDGDLRQPLQAACHGRTERANQLRAARGGICEQHAEWSGADAVHVQVPAVGGPFRRHQRPIRSTGLNIIGAQSDDHAFSRRG
ncbi:MAG: hypothetical protein ABSB67_13335 [Bryobacteraceae bacterium]